MAAPTAADLTTITTEGLAKAGFPSPSAALLSRAQVYWMREIKNDIWKLGKNLKSLQLQYPFILNTGQAQYEMPSDFSSIISLQILRGEDTGTATAGAAGTITLAAASTFSESYLQGREILITGGTGVNQISTIINYNTTTKVATVEPDFSTAPDSTSTYMIIGTYSPCTVTQIWGQQFRSMPYGRQRPYEAYIIGDSDSGKLIFNPAPDKTYGARMWYYANLMLLDLASTTQATLYRTWETTFIQGIFCRALQDRDDSRAREETAKYEQMIRMLVGAETYGSDLHELQRTVGE